MAAFGCAAGKMGAAHVCTECSYSSLKGVQGRDKGSSACKSHSGEMVSNGIGAAHSSCPRMCTQAQL